MPRRRLVPLLSALALALALGLPATAPGEGCRVTIRLEEEGRPGRALPGCLRISTDGARTWRPLPPLLPRLLGTSPEKQALGWHVVTGEGEAVLDLPREEVVVEAFSGLGTTLARIRADLREADRHRLVLPLRRLFDPAGQGWVAGNTHLHLQKLSRSESDRYLREIPFADGLEVVFVSYLERAVVDRAYVTNTYAPADLEALSGKGVVFGAGEEYRHNFGPGGEGYGHVLMLDLASRVLPASLGPGITGRGDDGTPLRPGLVAAREAGASLVWCHNAFGLEDLPGWLDGIVHAQNIFDGGNTGSYEDTFYRYLNLGMRVPFSTGTDWFLYDFSRVYVKRPEEGAAPLTPGAWLKWLRRGATTITNGVWIELAVEDRGPGAVIDLPGPGRAVVRARAIGRHDFGALELVRNGTVVERIPAVAADGRFEAVLDGGTLDVGAPCWVAARIPPGTAARNELGEPLFAHTSAVTFRVKGEETFLPEAAAAARADLEAGRRRIEAEGRFARPADRETVLDLYRDRPLGRPAGR